MADFDFLDGFDTGGDWGFTGVSTKPSDQTVADTKATEQVVKQTSESVGKAVSSEIISRLETKLDKILREVSNASGKIDDKHEVELEIAKSQMDDEYDLRKDNLGKIQKEKFCDMENYNTNMVHRRNKCQHTTLEIKQQALSGKSICEYPNLMHTKKKTMLRL